MIKWIVLLICACELMSYKPLFGFDGHREGFQLGFGVGASRAQQLHTSRAELAGVNTNLRIGFGYNDQISFFYDGRQLWDNSGASTGTVAYPQFSFCYHESPKCPSGYAGVGIGFCLFVSTTLTGVSDWNLGGGLAGTGFFGYEFSRHFELEAATIYSPGDNTQDLWYISISVIALAY